jgi:hypothetical protein
VHIEHNNQTFKIGSHDYNLAIYKKGKSMDQCIEDFFVENGFTSEETKQINRAELKLSRGYISQIKKKYDFTLAGMADLNNVAKIYLDKSKKYRIWHDLENHYHNKSRNKKFKEIDLLEGVAINYANFNVHKPIIHKPKIFKKPMPKTSIIQRSFDDFLADGDNNKLDLIISTAKAYEMNNTEVADEITKIASSVGRDIPPYIYSYIKARLNNQIYFTTKLISWKLKLLQHLRKWF